MQLVPAKNICPGFEFRHRRYFVAVAEELHFGQAARLLNVSAPPLSRQIQDLERSVGGRLLNRSSRTVTLTEAGKVFLFESKRVLADVSRAVELVRHGAITEVGAKSHAHLSVPCAVPALY
jgi:DNA-binding transcriptional LysR family regulator